MEGALEAADPAQVPGGVGKLFEQSILDGASGPDLLVKLGRELVELLLLVVADDDLVGSEALPESVFEDAGLALGRDRPGGALRIGAICRKFSP